MTKRSWTVRGIALVGIMVAAATLFGAPAQAAPAREWDTAVAGTPPALSSMSCVSMTGSRVCFQRDGDMLWVQDTASDSRSVVLEWGTRQSYDTVPFIRQGVCVNSLGNGRWGKCNKDFPESNWLHFRARVYDGSSGTWGGASTYLLTNID